MTKLFLIIILVFRRLKISLNKPLWNFLTKFHLKAFGVKYKKISSLGIPHINVKNGLFIIGDNFRINNNYAGNLIGRQQKCIFVVKNGSLIIGKNVGISSTAIVCHNSITIGNNVRIGGNTVIYDTDFHSLNFKDRILIQENKNTIKTKPVVIEDNVFVGSHSTILKGSIIGRNTVIGAGSIVSGIIPSNEIWGGNPIKFIRKIDESE